MKWVDALLGRSRPVKSRLDQMFGLSTAEITLDTELGLHPFGGAAVCFKAVSSGEFSSLQRQIDDLLAASRQDAPLEARTFNDQLGYRWVILTTPEFANLVATVHMVSRELEDNGFGEQLLATVFSFREASGRSVYWIYNYKRGTFYPFVPTANRERDNSYEVRLSAVMDGELAVEKDLTKWYALWGVPL